MFKGQSSEEKSSPPLSDIYFLLLKNSVRNYSIFGLVLIFICFFGAIVWSLFLSLEGAVIAQGVVVVQSNQQKIQHPYGGVIQNIFVQEGQLVNANEKLIELNDTSARTNSKIIDDQIEQLRIQKLRLEAERDDLESVEALDIHNVNNPKILDDEISFFNIRKKFLIGQKEQYFERIKQLKFEIDGLESSLLSKQKEFSIISNELEISETLFSKNLIPQTKLLDVSKQHFRLAGEIAQTSAQISSSRGKIQEYEIQIENLKMEFLKEVAGSIRDCAVKLSELTEKKFATDQILANTIIRSPVEGYIHQLSVHTIGGVIQQGELLALIIPRNDDLIIEAKINPVDIESIKINGRANLKFNAFNRHTTPEISGNIFFISPDIIQINSNNPTQVPYYSIKISVTKSEVAKLNNKDIRPGLPVEISAVTENRSVFNYLINPLLEQFSKTFKEK